MAFFNLLYHIHDVTVHQCKSNKHKAALQLRFQTHRIWAAPTFRSRSQLSPRRSHFLFLATMLKTHGLNHRGKDRNHHHIYHEFQHHSKTEHRKKGSRFRSRSEQSPWEGVTHQSLANTGLPLFYSDTFTTQLDLISACHLPHSLRLRQRNKMKCSRSPTTTQGYMAPHGKSSQDETAVGQSC